MATWESEILRSSFPTSKKDPDSLGRAARGAPGFSDRNCTVSYSWSNMGDGP